MSAIKVQGETYETQEELLMTINELQAKLDDLPESHPGRNDLAQHIERLKTAAGVESPPEALPAQGDEEPEAPSDEPPVPPTPEPPEEPAPPEPGDEEPAAPPDGFVCPVCNGRGWFPIEPPLDPSSETCPRCHGYGKVLTGSHVEGHELRDCPDCVGNGYITARAGYVPSDPHTASASPGWPGAQWNADEQKWEPPFGVTPPWTGAQWDEMRGTYA